MTTTSAQPRPSPSSSSGGLVGAAVGASVGGVVLVVMVTLIIVTAVFCARKKHSRSYYDYPLQDLQHNETAGTTLSNAAYVTAVNTLPNEAYASALNTLPNVAYSTSLNTLPNEAYATSLNTLPNEVYATIASSGVHTDENEEYDTFDNHSAISETYDEIVPTAATEPDQVYDYQRVR